MPIIIILSVVGAFSINNSIMDVYWMVAFGILGYLMKLYKIPVGPAILGIILSDLLELNFRRAALMTANSPLRLIVNIVTNPVSLVLLAFILVMAVTSRSGYQTGRPNKSGALFTVKPVVPTCDMFLWA